MSDLVELEVEGLGARGDGIAEHEGERVFLPSIAPGDRVRARLGVRRSGGREGRVVEWLAAGPGRHEPPCRHFGDCGGCALQHLDPASYRAAKLSALYAALGRVKIDPDLVQPLRVVPPARRRARLGLMRPRDPHPPGQIGYRQRFATTSSIWRNASCSSPRSSTSSADCGSWLAICCRPAAPRRSC